MSREAFEAWALRNTSLSSAHDMAWAAWQAALAQPQAEPAAAPAGWVMVPMEPTPEMWKAGDDTTTYAHECDESWSYYAYKAMIVAAPAHPKRNKGRPISAMKPLSGDALHALWSSENGLEDCEMCKLNDFTKAARFFEQAHGIAAPGSQP